MSLSFCERPAQTRSLTCFVLLSEIRLTAEVKRWEEVHAPHRKRRTTSVQMNMKPVCMFCFGAEMTERKLGSFVSENCGDSVKYLIRTEHGSGLQLSSWTYSVQSLHNVQARFGDRTTKERVNGLSRPLGTNALFGTS